MKAGIALGSNLGDRAENLRQGFAFLQGLSAGEWSVSSILETEPVDCPEGSGVFLNAVAQIDYAGSARALFTKLKAFERSMGRIDAGVNAPRPLDLDLLYFGDQVIKEKDLIVPHPRMTQRSFVLAPLAEIVPDLILPGKSRSIRELLHSLNS